MVEASRRTDPFGHGAMVVFPAADGPARMASNGFWLRWLRLWSTKQNNILSAFACRRAEHCSPCFYHCFREHDRKRGYGAGSTKLHTSYSIRRASTFERLAGFFIEGQSACAKASDCFSPAFVSVAEYPSQFNYRKIILQILGASRAGRPVAPKNGAKKDSEGRSRYGSFGS